MKYNIPEANNQFMKTLSLIKARFYVGQNIFFWGGGEYGVEESEYGDGAEAGGCGAGNELTLMLPKSHIVSNTL